MVLYLKQKFWFADEKLKKVEPKNLKPKNLENSQN